MGIHSILSKLLPVVLLLIAIYTVHADLPESEDLIANWSVLAKQRTQEAGSRIFNQAIVEATRLREEDPIRASRLFFKAAEFCRDLNDVRHAMTLFDLAIEANP